MDTVRTIRVEAPDDSLIRALGEHRSVRDGWRFLPLDGSPEPDGLVIVDLDADDARNWSIATLRARGFEGPALIIGGRPSDPVDPDFNLEDEPVPRPVRLGTLLARIDAHWAAPEQNTVAQLGPYQFLFAEQILRHTTSGEVIRLTELERKLLAYLVSAKGGLVDRPQLLLQVWGYSANVDTHTTETHIWRLRQKIETDDPATRFLITETGGYRLTT